MKLSAGVKKVRFFIALFLLLFFSINYFVPIKEFNTDNYLQFKFNDQKWVLKKDLLGFYMAPINGFLFKKNRDSLLFYRGYSNGIRHGEWKQWNENGNLSSLKVFDEGKKTGVWRSWNEKKALMFEADYTKGRIRQWFEHGQLEYEYFIKDGAEHGSYRKWNIDGLLIHENNYKNGKLDGPSRKWHSNGQPAYEYHFRNGIEKGNQKTFDETGKLIKEESV